jgi:hypothetical protein
METGVVVAELAASDTGTPLGVMKTKPFPVEGHVPGGPRVLETVGLSGADPWLSIQKYSI